MTGIWGDGSKSPMSEKERIEAQWNWAMEQAAARRRQNAPPAAATAEGQTNPYTPDSEEYALWEQQYGSSGPGGASGSATETNPADANGQYTYDTAVQLAKDLIAKFS
jgi:hypothetical protein